MTQKTEPAFLERDPNRPAEEQGLFRKFVVSRVDGSDQPGGKHDGCQYFVLDMTHDEHAPAALRAYAESCKASHPELSAELVRRFGDAGVDSEIEDEWTGRIRQYLKGRDESRVAAGHFQRDGGGDDGDQP